MSLNQARERLAIAEAELVRALTGCVTPPGGWDAIRLQATADVLARKRALSASRVWPERRWLAFCLGFFRRFRVRQVVPSLLARHPPRNSFFEALEDSSSHT